MLQWPSNSLVQSGVQICIHAALLCAFLQVHSSVTLAEVEAEMAAVEAGQPVMPASSQQAAQS